MTSSPQMRPVERPATLAQNAYSQIRVAIQERELVPGVFYSEGAIAKSLGMSRTPVREAILTLVREGLIKISSQRGFQICELSEAQLREVRDLTALVEAYAARRLAAEAGEYEIAQLRASIKLLEELPDDPGELISVDENFHLLMAKLLNLDRTHQMMMDVRGAMGLVGLKTLSSSEGRAAVIKAHHEIVDAIAEHNVDAASFAAQKHIHSYFGIDERIES